MVKKKYHIDINDIRYLRKMISNNNQDNAFDVDLERIDILINRMSKNYDYLKEEPAINKLKRSASYQSLFNDVYPFVRYFHNKGFWLDGFPQPKYKSVCLSDDDALSIANDFFKEQGSFYYREFNEFYKDCSSHLEFIEPNEYTVGETFFFEATGDAYVFSSDTQDFTKATILIHELEHVIDCFNNPNFYKYNLIRETSALFMEMIGSEYVAKTLECNLDDVKRRLYLHCAIKNDVMYLYDKNQILYLINNKIRSKKQIMKSLISDYGFTSYIVKIQAEKSLVEDYYYVISQLIAIELYNIYNKDKESALYILKDFILNADEENFLEVLSKHGIKLTRNFCKYEDDIILKLGL